jgi:hypothetical protein
VSRRRTQVTATIYDTEGFVFISFRGNAQDVGDAASIYVLNVAHPLGGSERAEVELVEDREEEGP